MSRPSDQLPHSTPLPPLPLPWEPMRHACIAWSAQPPCFSMFFKVLRQPPLPLPLFPFLSLDCKSKLDLNGRIRNFLPPIHMCCFLVMAPLVMQRSREADKSAFSSWRLQIRQWDWCHGREHGWAGQPANDAQPAGS